MKKISIGVLAGIILVGILAFTAINTRSNSNNKTGIQLQNEKDLSMARTQKMSGKYVFLECEPINEYVVAFEIKGFTMGHFNSPNEISNFVVKNALRIGKKQNIEFDAVVIGSGKADIAIKFK